MEKKEGAVINVVILSVVAIGVIVGGVAITTKKFLSSKKKASEFQVLEHCIRKDCDPNLGKKVCIERVKYSDGSIKEKPGVPTNEPCGNESVSQSQNESSNECPCDKRESCYNGRWCGNDCRYHDDLNWKCSGNIPTVPPEAPKECDKPESCVNGRWCGNDLRFHDDLNWKCSKEKDPYKYFAPTPTPTPTLAPTPEPAYIPKIVPGTDNCFFSFDDCETVRGGSMYLQCRRKSGGQYCLEEKTLFLYCINMGYDPSYCSKQSQSGKSVPVIVSSDGCYSNEDSCENARGGRLYLQCVQRGANRFCLESKQIANIIDDSSITPFPTTLTKESSSLFPDRSACENERRGNPGFLCQRIEGGKYQLVANSENLGDLPDLQGRTRTQIGEYKDVSNTQGQSASQNSFNFGQSSSCSKCEKNQVCIRYNDGSYDCKEQQSSQEVSDLTLVKTKPEPIVGSFMDTLKTAAIYTLGAFMPSMVVTYEFYKQREYAEEGKNTFSFIEEPRQAIQDTQKIPGVLKDMRNDLTSAEAILNKITLYDNIKDFQQDLKRNGISPEIFGLAIERKCPSSCNSGCVVAPQSGKLGIVCSDDIQEVQEIVNTSKSEKQGELGGPCVGRIFKRCTDRRTFCNRSTNICELKPEIKEHLAVQISGTSEINPHIANNEEAKILAEATLYKNTSFKERVCDNRRYTYGNECYLCIRNDKNPEFDVIQKVDPSVCNLDDNTFKEGVEKKLRNGEECNKIGGYCSPSRSLQNRAQNFGEKDCPNGYVCVIPEKNSDNRYTGKLCNEENQCYIPPVNYRGIDEQNALKFVGKVGLGGNCSKTQDCLTGLVCWQNKCRDQLSVSNDINYNVAIAGGGSLDLGNLPVIDGIARPVAELFTSRVESSQEALAGALGPVFFENKDLAPAIREGIYNSLPTLARHEFRESVAQKSGLGGRYLVAPLESAQVKYTSLYSGGNVINTQQIHYEVMGKGLAECGVTEMNIEGYIKEAQCIKEKPEVGIAMVQGGAATAMMVTTLVKNYVSG